MTSVLIPAPPFACFGVILGPIWTVVRDGVAIGEIRCSESDGERWYSWRIPGGRWLAAPSGDKEAAVAALERAADRPMPARRGIPAELRIAGLLKEQARREGTGDR